MYMRLSQLSRLLTSVSVATTLPEQGFGSLSEVSPRSQRKALRMRILVIGAGGVGTAAAGIAARRTFYEHVVVADHDPARARRAAAIGGDRFTAVHLDASSAAAARCARARSLSATTTRS